MRRKDTFREKRYGEDTFSKAQAIIREKLYRCNVSSVAEELCVEPRPLYNTFKAFGGCSPKEYICNYVIEMSKFFLINTTKNISEIAEEMGFSNQFHFSRVFHEKVGMAPREYRKRQRK